MHPLTESFWGWETEAQKGEGTCPRSQELANCRFKIQSQVSLMPKPTHSCTTIYYGQIPSPPEPQSPHLSNGEKHQWPAGTEDRAWHRLYLLPRHLPRLRVSEALDSPDGAPDAKVQE